MSTPVSWRFLRSAASIVVRRQCELSVNGMEHVPEEGPVIIASRHYHHLLDGAMLVSQIPRPSHIVVGLDWAGNPVVSRAMRTLCTAAGWPVVMRPDAPNHSQESTHSPAELRAIMRRAARETIDLLSQGRVIVVFPEGYPNIDPHFTPKQNDEFLPFQPGVVHFARIAEAGGAGEVPIVPLGLRYRRLDDKRWQVDARFDEAIRVADRRTTADTVKVLEARVRALSYAN